MLEAIETFCTTHEHTISAIEAVSTLSAVIVSLILAHRTTIADRTCLVATVQISTVFRPTISPKPRFFVVTITNKGNLPLHIPFGFFSWRVPFSERKWVILPVDSAGILGVLPQKTYPFEIQPMRSQTFYLSEASAFLDQMKVIRKEQNWIGGLLFFLKGAAIASADGQTFRAKGPCRIAIGSVSPLRSSISNSGASWG
jgi:hypothetical protein